MKRLLQLFLGILITLFIMYQTTKDDTSFIKKWGDYVFKDKVKSIELDSAILSINYFIKRDTIK